MSIQIPFDNSYARLPDHLFAKVEPVEVADPTLITFNRRLANELGITIEGRVEDAELAQLFSGNALPTGAEPIAQLYAGHQFGHWNPQLGDGRALLLGEAVSSSGRYDIQLKGSGPTPFSRNGDGRAWLGPVLREYVVSEAMHALGVPTTRALAAVSTGQPVLRETVLPGAILTRTATSHIRVGTFQILAARQDLEGLKALFEYALARHYPQASDPLAFLNEVIKSQAKLITKWMSFGFIHGVMNTDNCTISGETIDYGPCAFMDHFHPMQVFSSIDRQSRYAYGNQPDIIVWNMAQLATSLVPLMPDTDVAVKEFTEAIHAMPAMIAENWKQAFAAKIGIQNLQDGDEALIQELLSLMAKQNTDFTNVFRALTNGTAQDQFTDRSAFSGWETQWKARIASESDPVATMTAANPYIIPRNHQFEAMIQSAVDDDFAPFHRLNEALENPFVTDETFKDLTRPPAEEEKVHATFCGT